jgi:hypothetical protein
MSELHDAARTGDTAKIIGLLASSPDIDGRDKHSRTPLILAAWAGHLVGGGTPRCRLAIQLHQTRPRDRPAIPSTHLAGSVPSAAASLSRIFKSRTRPRAPQEVVKLLLANNANPKAAAIDDVNALHFAAQKGHLEVMRQLINAGARAPAASAAPAGCWHPAPWQVRLSQQPGWTAHAGRGRPAAAAASRRCCCRRAGQQQDAQGHQRPSLRGTER